MDFRSGLHSYQYKSVEGATVVASPLVERGNLLCLWELGHGGGARVSVSSIDDGLGSFRTSEILEGEPCHSLRWTGASVLVVMRSPIDPHSGQRAWAEKDRLYLLDASSLEVQAFAEIPMVYSEILFENGLLFYACQRDIQTKPEGEFHKLAPTVSDTEGEPRVTGWRYSGSQEMPWLTCYSVQELRPVKSWRLMGRCKSLILVPGHPGIVVTANPGVFRTTIEVLLNSRPKPAPVGAWEGNAVGPPAFVNGRGYWLTDVECLSWLETRLQAETREQPLPLRPYDYTVQMLDFSTGEQRVIALRSGENGKWKCLSLHDEVIIIQTTTMLIAYRREDLWAAADSLRNEGLANVARAFQCAGGAAPLKGALFGGPLQDDWGYQYEDATLHEILDDLLESPTEFWSASLSDRLKATAKLAEDLVRLVLTYWPDTIGLQAQSCPDDLFSLARAVNPRVDKVFGRLRPHRALADRILTWRQQAEATPGVLPPGAAERIARFLLHEHIRRRINMLTVRKVVSGWRDQRLIDSRLADELTPALEAALAWYPLERIEPSLAARFLKTFVTRWPEGAPLWEGDVRQYLEFLRDCARWGLLCRPARDSLGEAVSRAWSSAFNPRRRSVFISYSHHQEEVAQGLAAGLEQRGLRVALDRWEIGADSHDHAVETWIAETTISAEAKIFVLSSEALFSGWVNREIEWELRLLGVRRSMSLAYVLIAEKSTPLSLDAYPQGRIVRVADLEGRDGAAFDELALRIALDRVLQLQTARDGMLRGLPTQMPTQVTPSRDP